MPTTTSYKVPSGGSIVLVSRSKATQPLEMGLNFRITGLNTVEMTQLYRVVEDFKRIKTYSRPNPGDNLLGVKLNLDGVTETSLEGFTKQALIDLFAGFKHAFEPISGTRKTTKAKSSAKDKKATPVKRDFAAKK